MPWAYALPACVLLLIFTYYPMLSTLHLSFYDWNFVSPFKEAVGFGNYVRAFTSRDFIIAVLNTCWYTLGLIPLTVAFPLFLANMLHNLQTRFLTLYKVTIFTPAVVSFAVAAVLWLFILNPLHGLMNLLLERLSISGPSWLSDPKWVIPSILIITSWKIIGYNVIIFLAALLNVPKDIKEAALIDGAVGRRYFWSITWPLISPSTFFVLLTTVINATQYTLIPIQMLTGGGPDQRSTHLIFLVYQYAFRFFDVGYAAAVAVFTFLVLLGITVIQQKLLERYVHYEG